jgi:short-subunit dehydrogenase
MSRALKDMTVVITGASAGIGKALAEALDARGAKLVLCARRKEKLDELNAALGGRHRVVPADVSQQADCERLIATSLQSLGRIDTLVCNAGYGFYFRVQDTMRQQLEQIFATNVLGTTDCIHAAVPAMLQQPVRDGYRAQVMIVSSFVARRAVPMLGMYSATKAAQLSIAEALRVEVKGGRVAVTTVHPIMTRTDFGSSAEAMGEIRLPRDGDAVTQTVEHVARRMVRAIERPAPEVWPSRPSRWIASLATLLPRVMDRGMSSYFRKLQAANPDSSINDV